MKKKPPHPRSMTALDKAIARRILEVRHNKDVTQVELASRIGVTFQQQQKYERGTNRVTASRLFLIAQALDEPVSSFFE